VCSVLLTKFRKSIDVCRTLSKYHRDVVNTILELIIEKLSRNQNKHFM